MQVRYTMPRRKRLADVQIQFSQTEAGTSSSHSPRAVDQFHISLMVVHLFLHIRSMLLSLYLRTTLFPPSPYITILLWIILMTSLSSMIYRYRVHNLIILSHFNSCICNSFDIQCSVFFFL